MASRAKRTTAVTAAVIALVAGFEGLRTVAYRDPVGIPTVCFGETLGVHMGDEYTVEECKAMLGERLLEFETGVNRCLKNPEAVPLKTRGAFVSFAYNVGVGAFCKSTLLKLANAGNLRAACNELPKWVKAKGITLPGLVKRREAERKMCLEGLA